MQPLEMCHIGTKTGRTTMILISRENQMRRAKFLKEQQGEMEVEMEAEILILPNLKNQSEEVKQVEED